MLTPFLPLSPCLFLSQLSAVQFHLITTTILFLSREGFRRGGLRIQEQEEDSSSSSKKVGLCVCVSVPHHTS